MKHFPLFILCLFSLKSAIAQTDSTLVSPAAKQEDVLRKQDKGAVSALAQKKMLNERIRAQHEQAMHSDASVHIKKSSAKASPRSAGDADDDGMPDDWEALYGFSPSNPADAFGDFDLDGVMNLFEFQIGTSPKDADAPSVVDVSLTDNLDLLLSSAADQTLFRLQGGTYPLNYLSFTSPHPRIVIQGGWNESFTERDICLNPTVLDGQQADEIFYVGTSEGENAILLDGLTFRNGQGVYGSIKFISWMQPVTAFWSMVDCEIVQNAPTGGFGGAINFLHWDTSHVQVTLLNTVVTDNNNTCGVYNQTTFETSSRWRIYNSSIAFNKDLDSMQLDLGLGINGFTLGGTARLDITMTNSIVWGNDDYDLKFNGFGDSVIIRAQRCDIGNAGFLGDVWFDAAPDCIEEDPQFVDPNHGNLTLTTSSPCFDTGLPLGLAFEDAGPDIGATPCLLSVSAVHETIPVEQPLFVYPNPTFDFVEIKTNKDVVASARVSLYDSNGRLLRSAEFENNLRWEVGSLPAGVYWMQLQNATGSRTEQFVKL